MIGMGWAMAQPERVRRWVVLNTAMFPLPEAKPMPWQLSLGRDSKLGALLIRGFNAFSGIASYAGVERRMPDAVRRAYVAPYDTWRNRIATLRFVQDIPLREGDPAWTLVEAGGRAADVRRSTRVPRLGPARFRVRRPLPRRLPRAWPQAETHAFDDANHYVLEDKHAVLVPAIRAFLDRHALLA
jgi:pimeloyl-ACP methyl ester carboxylesterase